MAGGKNTSVQELDNASTLRLNRFSGLLWKFENIAPQKMEID